MKRQSLPLNSARQGGIVQADPSLTGLRIRRCAARDNPWRGCRLQLGATLNGGGNFRSRSRVIRKGDYHRIAMAAAKT